MPALPPPTEIADDKLLIVATNDIEPIVAAAGAARLAEGRRVTRIFLDTYELGALADIPAYRQGKARTVLLDFPSPELARQSEAARTVLRIGLDLTWVSSHPLDARETAGLTRLTVSTARVGALWLELARALDLPMDLPPLFGDILSELPQAPSDPNAASDHLRWRYALEAVRQELLHLGPRTQALIELDSPDPELVDTGHELLSERRDLALTSSFHSFPTATSSTGVIVVAPQWASGYYRDMVEDLRRAQNHGVSILAFDSQEPVIVEYSDTPPDFEAKLSLLGSTFPDHVVCPWRTAGVVIKGPATNDLALLDKLIDIIRQK